MRFKVFLRLIPIPPIRMSSRPRLNRKTINDTSLLQRSERRNSILGSRLTIRPPVYERITIFPSIIETSIQNLRHHSPSSVGHILTSEVKCVSKSNGHDIRRSMNPATGAIRILCSRALSAHPPTSRIEISAQVVGEEVEELAHEI